MTCHDGMKLHLCFPFSLLDLPQNMSKISTNKNDSDADGNPELNEQLSNLESSSSAQSEDMEAGPSGDYNFKVPCIKAKSKSKTETLTNSSESSLDEDLYGSSQNHIKKLNELRKALNLFEVDKDITAAAVYPEEKNIKEIKSQEIRKVSFRDLENRIKPPVHTLIETRVRRKTSNISSIETLNIQDDDLARSNLLPPIREATKKKFRKKSSSKTSVCSSITRKDKIINLGADKEIRELPSSSNKHSSSKSSSADSSKNNSSRNTRSQAIAMKKVKDFSLDQEVTKRITSSHNSRVSSSEVEKEKGISLGEFSKICEHPPTSRKVNSIKSSSASSSENRRVQNQRITLEEANDFNSMNIEEADKKSITNRSSKTNSICLIETEKDKGICLEENQNVYDHPDNAKKQTDSSKQSSACPSENRNDRSSESQGITLEEVKNLNLLDQEAADSKLRSKSSIKTGSSSSGSEKYRMTSLEEDNQGIALGELKHLNLADRGLRTKSSSRGSSIKSSSACCLGYKKDMDEESEDNSPICTKSPGVTLEEVNDLNLMDQEMGEQGLRTVNSSKASIVCSSETEKKDSSPCSSENRVDTDQGSENNSESIKNRRLTLEEVKDLNLTDQEITDGGLETKSSNVCFSLSEKDKGSHLEVGKEICELPFSSKNDGTAKSSRAYFSDTRNDVEHKSKNNSSKTTEKQRLTLEEVKDLNSIDQEAADNKFTAKNFSSSTSFCSSDTERDKVTSLEEDNDIHECIKKQTDSCACSSKNRKASYQANKNDSEESTKRQEMEVRCLSLIDQKAADKELAVCSSEIEKHGGISLEEREDINELPEIEDLNLIVQEGAHREFGIKSSDKTNNVCSLETVRGAVESRSACSSESRKDMGQANSSKSTKNQEITLEEVNNLNLIVQEVEDKKLRTKSSSKTSGVYSAESDRFQEPKSEERGNLSFRLFNDQILENASEETKNGCASSASEETVKIAESVPKVVLEESECEVSKSISPSSEDNIRFQNTIMEDLKVKEIQDQTDEDLLSPFSEEDDKGSLLKNGHSTKTSSVCSDTKLEETDLCPPFYEIPEKQFLFSRPGSWYANLHSSPLPTIEEGDLRTSESGDSTSRSYCVPEKRLCLETGIKTSERQVVGAYFVSDTVFSPTRLTVSSPFKFSGDYCVEKPELALNLPSSICDDSSNTTSHKVYTTTLSESSDRSDSGKKRNKKLIKTKAKILDFRKRGESNVTYIHSSESCRSEILSPVGSEKLEKAKSEPKILRSVTRVESIIGSDRSDVSSISYLTSSSLSKKSMKQPTVVEEDKIEVCSSDDSVVINPYMNTSLAVPPKTVKTYTFPAITKITGFIDSSGPLFQTELFPDLEEFKEPNKVSGDFKGTSRKLVELGDNYRCYKQVANKMVSVKQTGQEAPTDASIPGGGDRRIDRGNKKNILIDREKQSTDMSFYEVPTSEEKSSSSKSSSDYADSFARDSMEDVSTGCFCVNFFFKKRRRNSFL